MDLASTPEEDAFRQEVRAWVSAHLPEGWGTPAFKEARTFEER